MTTRYALRTSLALALFLGGAATVAPAETGYDLWLRYPQVADAVRLREYRAAIARLVVEGSSPTLDAARRELTIGLNGLLGTGLPVGWCVGEGTVLAGTPAGSPVHRRPAAGGRAGRAGARGLSDPVGGVGRPAHDRDRGSSTSCERELAMTATSRCASACWCADACRG